MGDPPGTLSSTLASLVRGERSSLEVVGAACEAADRREGGLNALTARRVERALAEAREIDRARRSGEEVGPLAGIPLVVKDLVDVEGMVTSCSSRVREGAAPAARDAEVVRRLRAAGAIVVAKSQTHEFAYGGITPQTVNPWDAGRIAGGSSGGSAVAVAAGEALGALGTDTAGSVRIPSACCGVVGLKPTFGLVSRRGVTPLSWSLDHVGPIAATVEDVGHLVRVMAGHDPLHPFSVVASLAGLDDPLEGRLEGRTVAIAPGYFFDRCASYVVEGVRRACAGLVARGMREVEVVAPLAELYHDAEFTILMAEASEYHREDLAARGELYGEGTRRLLAAGLEIRAVDYVRAQRHRARIRRAWAEAMSSVDVLLAPTLPGVAPPRGSSEVRHEDGSIEGTDTSLTRFNLVHDLTGFPALSLPGGLHEGLPWGLQLVARPFEEGVLLAVAGAVEEDRGGPLVLRPPGV